MLKIHFLNVGHGDCCIVEFLDNERTAIVDINRNSKMDKDSAEEIVNELSYFQKSYEKAGMKSDLDDLFDKFGEKIVLKELYERF